MTGSKTCQIARRSALPAAALAVGCALAIAVSGPAAAAGHCMALAQNQHVVEISEDGQTRKGSGVILTYDGYIITAAHLLLDEIAPPYPLSVSARLSGGDGEWQPARLKRIDKILDLALLKLQDYPNLPSIAAADLQGTPAVAGGEFCLAGFGIDKDAATGRKRDKPFLAFDVTYSGDERGYILASKPVEDGYSGGGAFRDGALMGMIVRRTTLAATVIVPIGFIVDFVAPEGIYLDLDNGRKFEPGVPASQLSSSIDKNLSRIEGNRLDIEKILRSVKWLVELSEPATEPKLVLTPDRSFPYQILDGYFIADLIVYFEDNDFETYIRDNPPLMTDIGIKIEDSGALVIDNLAQEIEIIRQKYARKYVEIDDDAPYNRIEIKGLIQFRGFESDPIIATFDIPLDNQ